jgi:hypothetical protein
MATSLASGRPCLGVYVERPGRVLLSMAEDAAAVVKQRLAAICGHRQLDLAALPIYVVTADALRLDQETDQQRLRHTVDRLRPRLLLLAPPGSAARRHRELGRGDQHAATDRPARAPASYPRRNGVPLRDPGSRIGTSRASRARAA